MPEGIEVDATAAYFGVFQSSDALHQMMEMPREAAFERFFALLSDLVLKPGEFDYSEASERLSCEGGEIYFLVAGHLGVMTLPEQLSLAIEEGQFSNKEAKELSQIADPMRLLKMFAIAYQTGGEGESTKYLKGLEALLNEPVANKDSLLILASEMKGAFDVAGHVTPIPSLASDSANASAVEAGDVAPLPTKGQTVSPQIPKVESIPISEPVTSIPLPTAKTPAEVVAIPLPEVEKVVVDDRKEIEKTDDAFSGAFGMSPPEVKSTPEPNEESTIETTEMEPEVEAESEVIDALEEAFTAADSDGSGGLSVEEVAIATGLDLEEAAKIHSEADIDGDGQVTLEELKAKPEVAVKMDLPKPVKPIRPSISTPQQKMQQQQQALQQQQLQQQQLQQQQALQQQQLQQQQQEWQQQQLQQQQMQQQQMQQQQGWNQSVQPTIRSGMNCRGCRIGVDPNWRFCPVCGTQNR